MAVCANFDAHLPCPNHCGESIRQEEIDNHRKACPLEEVLCEFSELGCDGKFKREDREEHARNSLNKHLTLMGTQVIATKRQQNETDTRTKKKTQDLEMILYISGFFIAVFLAIIAGFVYRNYHQLQDYNGAFKEKENKLGQKIQYLEGLVELQEQKLTYLQNNSKHEEAKQGQETLSLKRNVKQLQDETRDQVKKLKILKKEIQEVKNNLNEDKNSIKRLSEWIDRVSSKIHFSLTYP